MWRPTRRIPWLGFEVDTHLGAVKVGERKVLWGLLLREGIFGAPAGSEMSARSLLAPTSILNFLRWAMPIISVTCAQDGAPSTSPGRRTSGGQGGVGPPPKLK